MSGPRGGGERAFTEAPRLERRAPTRPPEPPRLSPMDAFKRRVYLATVAIGLVVTVTQLVLAGPRVTPSTVLLGLVAVQCLVLLGWLSDARRPVPFAERFALLGLAAQVFVSLARPVQGFEGYWPLLCLCVALMIVFDLRDAIRWVLAALALGFALPWAAHLAGLRPVPDLKVLTDQLACGAAVALTFALAWFKDRSFREGLRADEMRALAHTDPLTGAANRRRVYEALDAELGRAEPRAGLVLFDLDHFKRLNDTRGHGAGDHALAETVRLVRGLVRAEDTVGRWGGEEFIVVLPDADLDGAVAVAERLRAALAAHDFGPAGHLTGSFGAAELRPGDGLPEWVGRADAAVYAAKHAGRNAVRAAPGAGVRGGLGAAS